MWQVHHQAWHVPGIARTFPKEKAAWLKIYQTYSPTPCRPTHTETEKHGGASCLSAERLTSDHKGLAGERATSKLPLQVVVGCEVGDDKGKDGHGWAILGHQACCTPCAAVHDDQAGLQSIDLLLTSHCSRPVHQIYVTQTCCTWCDTLCTSVFDVICEPDSNLCPCVQPILGARERAQQNLEPMSGRLLLQGSKQDWTRCTPS